MAEFESLEESVSIVAGLRIGRVMHGPFVVAQQARGLLQDLTRVISPH